MIPVSERREKASLCMEEAWEIWFSAVTCDQVMDSAGKCLEALVLARDLEEIKEPLGWDAFKWFTEKDPSDYFVQEDLPAGNDFEKVYSVQELFLHKVQKYLNACFKVDRFE